MSLPELTARYLLVVDSLNFCFWQDEEFEYENLAGGIKVKAASTSTVLILLAKGPGERLVARQKPHLPLAYGN